MKNVLFLALFLFHFSAILANQQFSLSCNRIFTELEEVIVTTNVNRSYTTSATKFTAKFQFAIYQIEDLQELYQPPHQFAFKTFLQDEELQYLKQVKCWEEKLSIDDSWHSSKRINLGKLPGGAYILEAIYKGEVAQIPLYVTNYGITLSSIKLKTVAYVHDQNTGKAEEDFRLFTANTNMADYGSNIGKLDIIEATDYFDGLAIFQFEEEKNRYNFLQMPIIAIKGNKMAITQAYSYYHHSRYDQLHDLKAYLYTDRPAYRPEQWVYFKGSLRKEVGHTFEVVTDSVLYQINGPEGEKIKRKKVALDECGNFADSILVQKDWKLGTYQLSTSLNSDFLSTQQWYWHRLNSTGNFEVQEYKKPEFEVKVNLDKNPYRIGDLIQGTVSAHYFFGAPVTQATVKWKLMREEYVMPWYEGHPYAWWYADYYSPPNRVKELVKNGEGALNEKGDLLVAVSTDARSTRNYRYTLIAEVQDQSRRSISQSAQAIVAYSSLDLSLQKSQYYYQVDEIVMVTAHTKDLRKQNVEADLTAELYIGDGIEEHFISKQNLRSSSTTGKAHFEWKLEKAGYYTVKISAKDERGTYTTKETNFYVMKKGATHYAWWRSQTGAAEIMPSKFVYESGEPVKAMLYLAEATDALVTAHSTDFHYHQLHRFKAAESKDSIWEDGVLLQAPAAQEISIGLPKEVFGKVQIYIAYTSRGQLRYDQTQITIIPAHQYLNVSLSFDQDSYRPQNWATASLTVTDQTGKPVPNANVTLATADESIYSLYPDKTPDIRQFFYGNKELLQPANAVSNQMRKGLNSHSFQAAGLIWRQVKWNTQFARNNYLDDNEWVRILYQVPDITLNATKISGFVVDYETGKTLANAEVHIKDQTFKTNAFGYYSISGFQNKYVNLSFKKGYHKTLLQNIEVKDQQNIYLNVGIAANEDKILNLNPKIPPTAFLDKKQVLIANKAEDESILLSGPAFHNANQGYDSPVGNISGGMVNYADIVTMPVRNVNSIAGNVAGVYIDDAMNPNIRYNIGNYKEAKIRTDFQDAVYWNPNITTDKHGKAQVKIKLPDNLTTWRTTAKVITPDAKVGQTFVKITTQKDLLVRMEIPRFMILGDELLIATNVHNYLNETKQVEVSLFSDELQVEGTEQIIEVPANGEQRIDWKVQSKWLGKPQLTVKALTNEESDAKMLQVPILPSGLEMITAQSAHLQNTATAQLEFDIPPTADLNSLQLEVSTAPSIATALLSSLDDLVGYPYGCVEQTMSRFLPTVVVNNTLKTLGDDYVSSISADTLQKMVEAGIERLSKFQHQDGGWGWWETDASHPFMTAYVFYGLNIAREAGYAIEESMYNKGRDALWQMLRDTTQQNPTTHAYQMMVAAQNHQSYAWKYNMPVEKVEDNPYTQALWLQAATALKQTEYAKQMLQKLEANVIQTGTMNFWSAKKFRGHHWQNDQVETTAQVVKALYEVNPWHPMIAPAVQWLMQKRQGKSWHNTRQTAMVVYALTPIILRELHTDFTYQLTANNQKLEEKNIQYATMNEKIPTILLKGEKLYVSADSQPLANTNQQEYLILKHGKNTLQIQQTGEGSNYLNAKLTYFLKAEDAHLAATNTPSKSSGFTIDRQYYKLVLNDNQGKITYRKQPLDFKNIQSGDDILVKVKINSKSDQEFVLIEDPIPAGCEFIQERTGYVIEEGDNNEQTNSSYNYSSWFRRYNHEEYRDAKYALTITNMQAGDYEYSYLLKAQIPGTFQVNPAVVQLMYYPEVRGFSGFEEVRIGE